MRCKTTTTTTQQHVKGNKGKTVGIFALKMYDWKRMEDKSKKVEVGREGIWAACGHFGAWEEESSGRCWWQGQGWRQKNLLLRSSAVDFVLALVAFLLRGWLGKQYHGSCHPFLELASQGLGPIALSSPLVYLPLWEGRGSLPAAGRGVQAITWVLTLGDQKIQYTTDQTWFLLSLSSVNKIIMPDQCFASWALFSYSTPQGGSGCGRSSGCSLQWETITSGEQCCIPPAAWTGTPHQGLRAGHSHWTKQVKIHLYSDIYI